MSIIRTYYNKLIDRYTLRSIDRQNMHLSKDYHGYIPTYM